jgi:hypothetical protein
MQVDAAVPGGRMFTRGGGIATTDQLLPRPLWATTPAIARQSLISIARDEI